MAATRKGKRRTAKTSRTGVDAIPLKPRATPRPTTALDQTDADFEEAGDTVEALGDAGHIVRPPGSEVQRPPADAPKQARDLIDRVLRRVRELPHVPDAQQAKLEEYDAIMNELLEFFRLAGPLRPTDYEAFYDTFNLRKRSNESFRLMRELPLACRECGRPLRKQKEERR